MYKLVCAKYKPVYSMAYTPQLSTALRQRATMSLRAALLRAACSLSSMSTATGRPSVLPVRALFSKASSLSASALLTALK